MCIFSSIVAYAYFSRMRIIYVILSCVIGGLFCSNGCHAESGVVPEVHLQERGVILKDMLLCGPFRNRDSSSLDTDWLAALGQSEGTISAGGLDEISKKLPELFRKASIQGDHWAFDFHDLLGRKKINGPENLAAYLACNVVSDRDREGWLLLGADDEINVWLNDRAIFSRKGSHSLVTYERAVKIALNKGDNFLLIKVVNIDGDWGFAGRIEIDAEHAAMAVVKGGGHLLKSSSVLEDRPLELFDVKLPIALSAEGNCTNVLTQQSTSIQFVDGKEVGSENRSAGLYQLKMKLLGEDVRQYFLVGDLGGFRVKMEQQLESLALDDVTRIGLRTYIERIRIIQEAEKRNRAVNEWDRNILTGDLGYKAAFAARAFQEAIVRIGNTGSAFKDACGLSLRAFRSKIDDQVLYYRIYVPKSYERKKAPLGLIIVMHPIFSVPRAFIEGVEVANHEEAEKWGRVAEKLGVGILWEGYRVCPYGNPIEATHLDEVLDAVENDYDIDRARIGLYGECSGALGAALAVRQNPGRYSGVLFLNPVLKRLKNRMDDNGLFASFPGFRAWLAQQDPIALLSKCSIPINMVHDANDPAHGPLEDALAFAAAAKQSGKNIVFERPTAPAGEWFESTLVPRLEWLASQRRTGALAMERAGTKSEGPVSRFFTERFILVIPSAGPDDEKNAGVALAETFQKAWTRTNFGRCRSVLDLDLTREEEEASNLILIGSPSCNLVWRRLENSLYVQPKEEGLRIGTNYIRTKEVGIEAWCPHPSTANKKVLLIGGSTVRGQLFGTLELALDGWFDFAVWKQNTPRPVLLLADRYNPEQ